MDNHDCIEVKWPILQGIINKAIDSVNLDTEKPTPVEYMTAYSIVYDGFKCPKCSEEYCWKYHSTLRNYISSMVLPQLDEKNGEILLRELLHQWNKYKTLQHCLYKIFQYLEDYQMQLEGLPSFLVASHFSFHEMVYDKMNNRVKDALIFEINRERNGEQIDQVLMKNVLGIYLEIAEGVRIFYEKDFERAMLTDTATFYSKKALEWLVMSSTEASPYDFYMQKVQESEDEEKARVTNYLDKGSLDWLLQVVDYQLLIIHSRKLEEMRKENLKRDDDGAQ